MKLRLVSHILDIQDQIILTGKKPGLTYLRLQQAFYSTGHKQIHCSNSIDPINIDRFILIPGDPNQLMGKCWPNQIDTGKIKLHYLWEL